MPPRKKMDFDQFFQPPAPADDLAFLLGSSDTSDPAALAAERGLPLLHLDPATIAPDPDQLRYLPVPDDLRALAADGDPAAAELLAGLHELGHSIQTHGQLQPVVVYADSDPMQPHIRYRLLHGQRRWSAVLLLNLPTLWAVLVERPDGVSRLLRQYEENERRAGFSDMERTWALLRVKAALEQAAGGEVPWRVVEEALQISPDRRHDLLRLLRFPPEAQAMLVRYGWSEWTLRPLHMAINAGTLAPDMATRLLRQLATQPMVNATLVAQLLERELASPTPPALTADSPAPTADAPTPEAAPLPAAATYLRRLSRTRRSIETLQRNLPHITDAELRAAMHAEAQALHAQVQALLDALAGE